MSLSLPDATLDSDIAILGRKGGGKTFTAKGIVERLLDMKRRVLILDPLGVWAGLRTAANGTGAGYPVAIFGGLHADLPLDLAAAVPLARIIAAENLPAVLDFSELSKHKQQGFLFEFLHELRTVNREALTIVLEEADVFAPQNPQGDDSKQLHGEIDWVARRGRFRGFRLITITQRPARLSKDVLTQCSTLIAHRLPSPQDRDAVKAWVDGNGDRDRAREVFDTLASLAVGEAWVWAPEHSILERAKFPRIKTLDTSATPKAGEKRIEPKRLADVDVSAVRKALAEAVPESEAKSTKRPAIDQAAIEHARKAGYDAGFAAARFEILLGAAEKLETIAAQIADITPQIRNQLQREISAAPLAPKVAPKLSASASGRPIAAPAPPKAMPRAAAGGAGLSKAERLVLTALAQYPDGRTKNQVAILTGYAVSGGGFNNAISACRARGYLEGSVDRLTILPGGVAVLGAFDPLPHGDALLQHWYRQLGKAERACLEALVEEHPRSMPKDAVAARAGYEPNGGGFNNALSRLRTLELISGNKDALRASEALFG